MSEYTKGKWNANGRDVYHGFDLIAVCSDAPHDEDAKANARLIAAAPYMHDALMAFVMWWRLPNELRTIENIEPAMRLCFDSITKAEGNA